jgi:hypothetical protein
MGSENVAAPKPDDVVNMDESPIMGEILTLEEIQKRLNHTRLDLLKMDIEGYEWPILQSWPELSSEKASQVFLPMQVLVEVHYQSQMRGLWRPGQTNHAFDIFSEKDIIELQRHLLKMGYATAVRDDNQYCPHCTELTLLRYRCH